MSEYVTMSSINLKNRLMDPKVLDAYRSGNLNYQTLTTEESPLNELYKQTYNYLLYPTSIPKNVDQLLKPVEKK